MKELISEGFDVLTKDFDMKVTKKEVEKAIKSIYAQDEDAEIDWSEVADIIESKKKVKTKVKVNKKRTQCSHYWPTNTKWTKINIDMRRKR